MADTHRFGRNERKSRFNFHSSLSNIFSVIPQVAESINKSSVLLLTEICTFIVHCMHQKRQLIDRVAREYGIVSALISVLNVESFGEFLFHFSGEIVATPKSRETFVAEKIPKLMKHECWSEALTVLKWLSRSSIGFQAICVSFEQNNEHMSNTFNIFAHGLTCKGKCAPAFCAIVS